MDSDDDDEGEEATNEVDIYLKMVLPAGMGTKLTELLSYCFACKRNFVFQT